MKIKRGPQRRRDELVLNDDDLRQLQGGFILFGSGITVKRERPEPEPMLAGFTFSELLDLREFLETHETSIEKLCKLYGLAIKVKCECEPDRENSHDRK